MNKILDIDDFDSKYTMYEGAKSEFFDHEFGRFETFGNDVQEVLKIANGDKPNRVWTAVDCDDGFYLINGYALVNRVYYMVTNEEGDSSGEEYLIDAYDEEEYD